jgi:hypothetical protein
LDDIQSPGIYIASILPASIADRWDLIEIYWPSVS